METNKKITKVFFLSVILPLVLAFLNWKYSNYYIFQWGYRHINEISIVSLIITIISGGFILYLNNKYQKSKVWNFIAVGILFFSSIYLYIIYSFSNFGF